MKSFVSEEAFKKRVNYFGDFVRVEGYERVAIDLDMKPLIGYENVDYLVAFVESDNFPNAETQTLFEAYILDLTIMYMAYRSYPIIFRHLDNAGVVDVGENPISVSDMQRVQNSYIQLANSLYASMIDYYCLKRDKIDLPEPLERFDHAPYAGINLNIGLESDREEIPYKVVALIELDIEFYYGVIAVGEDLTLEIILAGTKVSALDVVSWIPNNGNEITWFASSKPYSIWAVENDQYNSSTIGDQNGLFNSFSIGEFITHQQNYVSNMSQEVLSIKV